MCNSILSVFFYAYFRGRFKKNQNNLSMKNLIYLFLLVAIVSCTPGEQEDTAIHGIDPANMDATANPNDDFYTYANGTWLDKTEIPGKAGAWGWILPT